MPVLQPSDAAALVGSSTSVGIGGFGLDRKPLALVDLLIQRKVHDLDLHVYAGGLDVERLLNANAARSVSFSHVGLDQFGLSPAFRRARESGQIVAHEWSEWSMLVAWRAAAEHVPFTAVSIDPATELFRVNPSFGRIRCPFSGVDTAVVKSPAIEIALLHAEAVHPDGWVINRGDEYADALLARAAALTIVCAERMIDDAELQRRWLEVRITDTVVDHIVICPGGASPGSCNPVYGVNSEAIQSLLGPVRP